MKLFSNTFILINKKIDDTSYLTPKTFLVGSQCLIYYIRLDGCNNCNKPQRDTLKIALGIKLFCLWSELAEIFFCNVIRV